MSVTISGVSVPANCFRCFASQWIDEVCLTGFSCRAMPDDMTLISNNMARSGRRKNCPIVEAHKMPIYLITNKEVEKDGKE